MAAGDTDTSGPQAKVRREAAEWFARMRGPNASARQREFDHWRKGHAERQAVYDRLLRRWDEAEVLRGSRQTDRRTARTNRRLGLRWPSGWITGPPLALFASAMVLFLLPARPAWVYLWPVPSAWTQRLATPVGQIRTVRLADGSAVTLDTDTILVTRMTRSFRRLTLVRGRARFDVAHDPVHPFTVAAGGGSVVAIGTLFDVSLTAGHRVAVTLIRGVVDVRAPAKAGGWTDRQATARLAAGEQYAFGRGVASPGVRPASPGGALWPSRLLTFDSTPLSEAVAEANRYSHSQIRLASPDLGALQVSGVFPAASPRAFAQSLAMAFDLRLTADPAGDLVLDRAAAESTPTR